MKTYCKTVCFFCGKTISANGAARAAHGRMHVRKGEAVEIGIGHPWYRGQVEFTTPEAEAERLKSNKWSDVCGQLK